MSRRRTRSTPASAPRLALAPAPALALGFALALGLALLALAVPAAHARLHSSRSRGSARADAAGALLGGVNITNLAGEPYPTSIDQAVATAQKLHAKLVRYSVAWSAVQPQDSSSIDADALAEVDRVVDDATARDIGVVLTISGTPCWASSAPPAILSRCVPGKSSRASSYPPRNPQSFAQFAAYVATRYGSKLKAIEIWNEPDQSNEDYFAGPEKAPRYAAIVRAAYPAIKQANPNVLVLAGSLVGSNGAFLRALYAAGMKGYYDGLAVHYYDLTLGSVRSIHETQLANGDHTPLWLNEFGWSSCYPHRKIEQEQACVTAKVQAENLKNTVHELAQAPYVAADIVYKLQDSPAEQFGVLTVRGAHKPAFDALASVLASPFGPVSPVRLTLRRSHGQVLASGSGPVGDFMQLEAFIGGTLRYEALFTLNRFNRYSIALPKVLGTHGLRVTVYQYWSRAQHVAQATI